MPHRISPLPVRSLDPRLAQAIDEGDPLAVRACLRAAHCDANARTPEGHSALGLALGPSLRGDHGWAEDIDRQVGAAWRPALIQALVAAGARPDLPCHREHAWTPLHQAAALGDPVLLRRLLSAPQVDVEVRDDWGRTPLMVALTRPSVALVSERWDLQLLKRAGASLDVVDHHGKSPLAVLLEQGRLDVLAWALDHQPCLSARTRPGKSVWNALQRMPASPWRERAYAVIQRAQTEQSAEHLRRVLDAESVAPVRRKVAL